MLDESLSKAQAPVLAAGIPSGERVLIVEDDIDTLDTFRDLLLLEGVADVRCARSVSEAEEVLADGFLPSAILLDLLRGTTRGEEFAGRLRGDPVHGFVPIIALSGDIRALRSLGAVVDRGFLKPTEPARILNAIRDLCLKARRARNRGRWRVVEP